MKTADLESMAGVVVDHVKSALQPQNRRLAELERRIAELEARALKAGGVWQRGQAFQLHDCVQFDGSLWRCVEAHTSGATFSHEHFVLVVKRGRDGKDSR